MNRLRLPLLTLLVSLPVLLTGCPAPPPPADSGAAPTPGAPASASTSAAPGDAAASGNSAGSTTTWGPADGLSLGGYMSLTDSLSSFGQSSNKGMGLAIEEINAKGGVNGQQLTLHMEDSASKQEEAKNAVRRLLDKHQAKVVIGEVASSLSLAVAPDCQAAKVPMVSPSSTNPTLTAKGDFIFRTCFTDDQQGAYVAKFALTKGWKAGVILRDINSDYSKGQSAVITKRFTAGGGKIVSDEGYTQKQPDFSSVLTKVKAKNPDVIFVPGYYNEAGLIIKQARELGIKAAIVGADGWDSPVLKELAGDLLNDNCYFVNHYSKTEDRPRVKEFVAAYKAKFNEEPDALAACAYDSIYVVAEAIKAAGSTEPQAIRDALAKVQNYDGVTGQITIDAQRNASKPCVVLAFKDGQEVIETTLQPSDV
ncbi:MAG: ABC transporter substrate-binding protein [Fimbriimonadaceae bacterium]|nr:ABC transporter substrate-binding protein [Fimbriimonadaceae bacterium]